MTYGYGSAAEPMSPEAVREILTQTFASLPIDGRRVLVIIPDATRSAPIPLMYEQLNEIVGPRAARVDFLIALGTHPPMPPSAIDKLVGMSASEREARYPASAVYNHHWEDPAAIAEIGVISSGEIAALSEGLVSTATPVRINRMIFDYDHLVICGPVFPHEVVGFSGGAKYFFPGIAAGEIINTTHWIGALATCMATIGVKDTPIRRVIHRAAQFIDRPSTCLAMVMQGSTLHGLFTGGYVEAWEQAADLSRTLNIVAVPSPFRSVLSMPSERYDDLWTAAKAMYKTEPIVADGGEVIIYAPHITEVSYTHGALIDEIGYHVRDYFTKQWEKFGHYPGGVLAHSTHVKGAGGYDPSTGVETPRIQVTLATSIPEERCRRINLGYADYRSIDPAAWAGREAEGLLLVEHAGEVLFRLGA